jgi:predicted nuclease of restriction endonuclease-like (RecB) superfamily
MDFDALVHTIADLHHRFQTEAVKAVNISLTLRNWMIGFSVKEYEQAGEDRATYGSRLFEQLSHRLRERVDLSYHPRELRRCRQFYEAYPQIRGALSPQFSRLLPHHTGIEIWGTPSPESVMPADRLIASLSFSHFAELIEVDQPLKRAFYEIECIKGGWSVRELKRQIVSLYYERSALSRDKDALSRLAQGAAETSTPALAIRDPYVFEFLGLKPSEAMRESDLADALLDKLQEFLMELGRGFCLEARQKRILIGGEYFFVDLVFYHRIVKCHVLIELKVDGFKHEYLGQLNTYVTWFREHEMAADDNPPVGILLCTDKNHALVKYALAGMDNHLFVSKYELQLPGESDMRAFLEEQYHQLQGDLSQSGGSSSQLSS